MFHKKDASLIRVKSKVLLVSLQIDIFLTLSPVFAHKMFYKIEKVPRNTPKIRNRLVLPTEIGKFIRLKRVNAMLQTRRLYNRHNNLTT